MCDVAFISAYANAAHTHIAQIHTEKVRFIYCGFKVIECTHPSTNETRVNNGFKNKETRINQWHQVKRLNVTAN